ncbi:DUF6297 family protein [Cellulomonas sp. KRMCY2]|uniref:DUF6297 family protein n=1 Tax=Cellulomonas sp. KRMCY2 TaxID=1304865 RepID=UPI0004B53A61|nr:DUF6297 family protein [Cellulomonas sp. KRMCY2]
MTQPLRATLVHDPAKVPSGGQVRHLTARIQGARQGHGAGAVLIEIWYTIITVGLSVTFVIGIADSIQASAPGEGGPVMIAGELPAALVVLAAAGAVLSLAGRLGPVGLGGGGAAWWLPMPIDRRGLLRPTVLRWPSTTAAAGAVLAPLIVFAFGVDLTISTVLAWAALGGASFAALTALAAVAQSWHPGDRSGRSHRSNRVTAAVGDTVLLGATAAVAGLALVGPAAASASGWELGGGWWASIPLLLAAVVGTLVAERRTALLSGAGLRALGSVGDRAQVAVLSLDLRELSRALTTGTGRARRRGSLRLAPGGPRRAVVRADLVLLARTPRLLVQIAVAALLAVAATRVTLLGSGLPMYGTLVLTGFWAANTSAAGARHADMAPVLDRLLPLSAREVRLTRGVVPLAAAAVWTVTVLGLQAARTGEPLWLALALPWTLVLAVAALRSAYRPPPRASRVPVASPMGSVPPTGGLFHGLDVALVGTLPTAIALYVGVVSSTLVTAQLVMAGLVVAVLVGVSGTKKQSRV